MWEDIEQQVKQVIAYSQGLDISALNGVHRLIEQWQKNKKEFYTRLRHQLILKTDEEVTFELDPDSRRKQLMSFICRVEEHYHNRRLALFLDENSCDFFNNILQHDYELDAKAPIKKGTKIVKAFKYFVPDKDELHAIQDEASMLIQENKVTGRLCFSIHPLDFLFSSENTYNWRSCHALDGDYRAGNLDYMIDKSTIICYLEGAENVKLPNFPESVPWNSKKWRMLLHFSDDMQLVFAGRQYPFISQVPLEIIREKVLPLLCGKREQYISQWHDDILHDGNFNYTFTKKDENYNSWPWKNGFKAFVPNGIPIPCRHLIRLNERHYHYNDLLYSTIYENPYYAWTSDYYSDSVLHIGGDLRCVCCGEDAPFGSESMVCDDCYDKYMNTDITYCECCERRIYDDEPIVYMHDGSILCSECAANEAESCAICLGLFYKNNLRESKKGRVCPTCYAAQEKIIPTISLHDRLSAVDGLSQIYNIIDEGE